MNLKIIKNKHVEFNKTKTRLFQLSTSNTFRISNLTPEQI